MVRAHRVLHGGRVEQLCYLTTAAMAWLLTGGIDRVPPFSGVWRERGTGASDADRAIAYGYSDDDDGFDEDHTLIALTRGPIGCPRAAAAAAAACMRAPPPKNA